MKNCEWLRKGCIVLIGKNRYSFVRRIGDKAIIVKNSIGEEGAIGVHSVKGVFFENGNDTGYKYSDGKSILVGDEVVSNGSKRYGFLDKGDKAVISDRLFMGKFYAKRTDGKAQDFAIDYVEAYCSKIKDKLKC